MNIIQAIEIFAFVTGILYIVLEILQKDAMWVVGILTGAACAYSFALQHSWGMAGLNVYYVVMSVVGLVQWRQDGAQVEAGAIHLQVLPKRTAVWSAGGFVAGSLALVAILRALGDGASSLDAAATVLSIIATWWLTRSYLQQWMLWVVADILTALLCLLSGQYWMTVLYLAYTVSALYGYFHWKRHGVLIDNV
ncbi:MAG: nicotinamide mononucleotide transporter [Bacteroidales bacterium]|nr:nicotinamide mononucleotide transporter [Bacteroidales bacterium]